jgi:hypothetical protein
MKQKERVKGKDRKGKDRKERLLIDDDKTQQSPKTMRRKL